MQFEKREMKMRLAGKAAGQQYSACAQVWCWEIR